MRFRLAGRNDRRFKDEGTDPTPDRVEGDVKDMVYQTAEIAFFVREIPNQVGNDRKAGMTRPAHHTSDREEDRFFVREIPNQVGNDSVVIFIVILMLIMSH